MSDNGALIHVLLTEATKYLSFKDIIHGLGKTCRYLNQCVRATVREIPKRFEKNLTSKRLDGFRGLHRIGIHSGQQWNWMRLRSMKNIQSVSLIAYRQAIDIDAFVQKFHKVTSLRVQVDGWHSMHNEQFTNLQKLKLVDVDSVDIELGHLQHLTHLTLTSKSITTLDGCKQLKVLRLLGCPSIHHISTLTELEDLYMTYPTQINSLHSNLKLRKLHLGYCRIGDIRYLTNLEELHMGICSHIPTLRGLTNLRKLDTGSASVFIHIHHPLHIMHR